MPYSSGTFSLYSPGNPVVTGTTISSTWANNTLTDIATGLSTAVLKDGTQTIAANIPMSSFKLTGLGAGSANGDSLRYEQSNAALLTAQGDIIYASAANTPARLAIGTANQVLRTNAGATAPEWAAATGLATTTLATPQATTSGTSIDFGTIPSGVKRITIMLVGVSTNGTNIPVIQLGDSGGIENSGYVATLWDTGGNFYSPTTWFPLSSITGTAAALAMTGNVVLTLENESTNTWTCSGIISAAGSNPLRFVSGSKPLSAVLDRIRLTTDTGVDTFDAGAINIQYQS